MSIRSNHFDRLDESELIEIFINANNWALTFTCKNWQRLALDKTIAEKLASCAGCQKLETDTPQSLRKRVKKFHFAIVGLLRTVPNLPEDIAILRDRAFWKNREAREATRLQWSRNQANVFPAISRVIDWLTRPPSKDFWQGVAEVLWIDGPESEEACESWCTENLEIFSELKQLDLTGTHLLGLPDQVTLLTNLEELKLQNNKLILLNPAIGMLPKLRRLDLAGNHLSRLPLTLVTCTSLRVLGLDRNYAKLQIDEAVVRLQQLGSDVLLRDHLMKREESPFDS